MSSGQGSPLPSASARSSFPDENGDFKSVYKFGNNPTLAL